MIFVWKMLVPLHHSYALDIELHILYFNQWKIFKAFWRNIVLISRCQNAKNRRWFGNLQIRVFVISVIFQSIFDTLLYNHSEILPFWIWNWVCHSVSNWGKGLWKWNLLPICNCKSQKVDPWEFGHFFFYIALIF